MDGLLPTVAWAAPATDGAIGAVAHALDGGVFTAGALLEWLAAGSASRRTRPRWRRWRRRCRTAPG